MLLPCLLLGLSAVVSTVQAQSWNSLNFSLEYPPQRDLVNGTSCYVRPDNASTAPFRTPFPVGGPGPIVFSALNSSSSVLRAAIIWDENPQYLQPSTGFVQLTNGSQYSYGTTKFNDTTGAREQGRHCTKLSVSDNSTAYTSDGVGPTGTPAPDLVNGTVGTLVVSYGLEEDRGYAPPPRFCADIVLVSTYYWPEGVNSDQCGWVGETGGINGAARLGGLGLGLAAGLAFSSYLFL
ncbi:hypothetical protein JCM8547_002362 [Rhodosporidiobolus lusitaniae]